MRKSKLMDLYAGFLLEPKGGRLLRRACFCSKLHADPGDLQMAMLMNFV